MKYLKYFNINEGKNYSSLYHFTMLIDLVRILDSDKLYSNSYFDSEREPARVRMMKNRSSEYKSYISFTRNKNYNSDHLISKPKSIIEVDGDKLSDNYKLIPFNFFNDEYIKTTVGKYDTESEETLLLKNNKYINIKKYIIKLYIPSYKKFKYQIDNYTSEGFELDKVYSLNKILGTEYSKEDVNIMEDYSLKINPQLERLYSDLLSYIKESKISYEIY